MPLNSPQPAFQNNVANTPTTTTQNASTAATPTYSSTGNAVIPTDPIAKVGNNIGSYTPQTGTVTPPPSSVQSTDVNTLTQPTVNTSNLPTPTGTPAPVPDLSTITAQADQPTQSQGQFDSLSSQIQSLTGQLGNENADYQTLFQQQNMPQLQATSNDIAASIANYQSQRDQIAQQIKNQYGNDASKGYMSFEQQSADGYLAALQSSATATLAAINGKISTAQANIDNAIKYKYDPMMNQINALKTQADLVSSTLNREQTKQLAVMNADLADRTATITANRAISSTMLEKIATAAANPGNPAPAYVVTEAQKAALSDNPASALDIISPYLQDPLAAKQEIADIQQKQASAAASYADVALKQAQAKLYSSGSSPSTATGGTQFTYNGQTLDSSTANTEDLIAYAVQNGTLDPSQMPRSATSPARQDIIAVLRSNPNFNFITNKANIAAAASAARTQGKTAATLQMNLATIKDHISTVQDAINQIPQTDIGGLNTLQYKLSSVTNPTEYAAFTKFYSEASALREEVAKALGGGQATDAARAAAADIIPENVTPAQFNQIVAQPGGIESMIQAKLDASSKPVNVPNYTTGSSGSSTTVMTGPDGKQYNVPNNQVQAFIQAGGHQ